MEFFSSEYEFSQPLGHKPVVYYGKPVEKLGEGTYGVVYAYQHDSSDVVGGGVERYAIKIVSSKNISKTQAPARSTLVEISMLRRLSHPNVVRLLDVIIEYHLASDQMSVLLVQPLAKYDLKTALKPKSGENFSLEDLNLVAYQVLCGVEYLQSRHIIHGDLKTANILFYSVDDIRIADFGLAIPYACRTQSVWPDILYSLWERPPEILLSGIPRYTLPADVWATGIVLWEIYTNDILFPGEDEADMIRKISDVLGTPGVGGNWQEARSYELYPKFIDLSKPAKLPDRNYFTRKLPNRQIADIISSMIVYQPTARISSYLVLRDSYFDSVRSLDNEVQMLNCYYSHETRDRYPSSYLKYVTNEAEVTAALSAMSQLAKRNSNKPKTLMTAVQIFDEYLNRALRVSTNLEYSFYELALGSYSLALSIVENIVLTARQWTYYDINIRQISLIQVKIAETIDYDFLFTVPVDYRDELEEYGLDDADKQLAIAYMVTTGFGTLKFSLLPHDIFSLAVAIVLGTPESVELQRLLKKYESWFWEDFLQFEPRVQEYFDKLTGLGTYEDITVSLEEGLEE